jgi:hypothetical protein
MQPGLLEQEFELVAHYPSLQSQEFQLEQQQQEHHQLR